MKLRKAVYAGSFDPYTVGHDDILQRSLKVFDEITILVAISPNKKAFFTTDERVEMLNELYSDEPRVKIDSSEGLLVDYAKNNNIGSIVRGLRPTGDFEIEFQMASMNNKLFPEIETFFLMTEGQNYYISSSLVKEVFKHGGEIKEFVPPVIYKRLINKK